MLGSLFVHLHSDVFVDDLACPCASFALLGCRDFNRTRHLFHAVKNTTSDDTSQPGISRVQKTEATKYLTLLLESLPNVR